MINVAISLAVTTIAFALMIMWFASLSMIHKKDIMGFLSFFLMGIILTIYATFILFEFYFQLMWTILELLILLNLIWIFITIFGGKNE
jgi:hypothetical protein